MVAAFAPHASRIISVEIDDALYRRACERFAHIPSVELIPGDALYEIPRIAANLTEPALFWLDGHFCQWSRGRGVVDEPAPQILTSLGALPLPAGTIIVVDDVSLFGGLYPPLRILVDSAADAFPNAQITVRLNSLVIRTTRSEGPKHEVRRVRQERATMPPGTRRQIRAVQRTAKSCPLNQDYRCAGITPPAWSELPTILETRGLPPTSVAPSRAASSVFLQCPR